MRDSTFVHLCIRYTHKWILIGIISNFLLDELWVRKIKVFLWSIHLFSTKPGPSLSILWDSWSWLSTENRAQCGAPQGLDPRTLRLGPELKSRVPQQTEPPRHPSRMVVLTMDWVMWEISPQGTWLTHKSMQLLTSVLWIWAPLGYRDYLSK